MSGLVFASIAERSGALVILDAGRRLYAGLSHDGSYWHVVSPAQADAIDVDGNVTRRAGTLACLCKGSIFQGTCYRTQEALAFEAGDAERLSAPAWMRDYDAPVGAGESVEASRG